MSKAVKKSLVLVLVLYLAVAFTLTGCSFFASKPEAQDGPDPANNSGQEEPSNGPDENNNTDTQEEISDTEPDPESNVQPDPESEPGSKAGSDPKPGTEQEPAKPEEKQMPVIYIGQVLKLPATGTVQSKSQVVQKSLISGSDLKVALTFDSGWLYESTLPLLDVLDAYGVKATFFPRALWVYNPEKPQESYPDLAREIVKRGHTLGNHSLTHPDMTKMTLEEVRHELKESTRLIEETTGVRPYLFRPPYGAYNQDVLKILAEEGLPYSIMWTIDTHDWAEEMGGKKVTASYIVQRVLDNITPGAIVLMHIGGTYTVEALPAIIEGLREKGYDFTTVDKMVPSPKGTATGYTAYTVQKGDTLYSLAKKYNTTVEKIIADNDL